MSTVVIRIRDVLGRSEREKAAIRDDAPANRNAADRQEQGLRRGGQRMTEHDG